MNIDNFISLCESREMYLKNLFIRKHTQYGTDEDVFKNNAKAAALSGLSPEKCLIAQVSKHIGLLGCYAEQLGDEPMLPEKLQEWQESMDDVSLWMSILNGLLEERLQKSTEPLVACKTCNGTGRVWKSSGQPWSPGATIAAPCPDCQKGLAEDAS